MLFVGDDWAEAHHDIEIENEEGRVLARRRLPEGLAGITMLHELIAEHLDPTAEPDQVQLGIETERGPWVQALLAAGYVVYAINPLQVARYRERHSPSGAKSDAADAHLLAEIVRLDRAHHRRIAGVSWQRYNRSQWLASANLQPLIHQQVCGKGEKQGDHGGDDQHKELITHTLADGLHDDPDRDEPTDTVVLDRHDCTHRRSERAFVDL